MVAEQQFFSELPLSASAFVSVRVHRIAPGPRGTTN